MPIKLWCLPSANNIIIKKYYILNSFEAKTHTHTIFANGAIKNYWTENFYVFSYAESLWLMRV